MEHQDLLIAKRAKANPTLQQVYTPGDFILLHNSDEFPPKDKLHPTSLGPFVVVAQYRNDVDVKSLIDGSKRTFYVGDISPFFGSDEDARRMAAVDDDQYDVQEIIAYRGDPNRRSFMQFLVPGSVKGAVASYLDAIQL
jgi:hypothetical protein